MKLFFKSLLVLVVLVVLYFTAWPVPIEPKSWEAPKAPELASKYAVNSLLADFEAIDIDGLHGPEAITANARGDIYSTTHEGWIIRILNGSEKVERWVDVGGRPLGIAFDSEQNLWVANAFIGLQKVDTEGVVTVETTMADSVRILFADDVEVTPNGKVYFSDASTKFSAGRIGNTIDASLLDIFEHGLHGRIIEYDPVTKTTQVIMRDLSFANGVTSSEAGDFLMVVETGSYRIWKHWLEGDKAGQNEVVIDNLPGFPDNIHRGQNGRYWFGLTSPRLKLIDALSGKPFIRKMVQRLPASLGPNIEPYGHIIAIDESGRVLLSLQDPNGAYFATTGAWETDDYLYISSLTAPILARFDKTKLPFKF